MTHIEEKHNKRVLPVVRRLWRGALGEEKEAINQGNIELPET